MNFGEIIGITDQNVIAFSNENSNNQDNYYNGIYTGLKYECVEFARRWLIIVYGITFESVDHAKDIYNLNHFLSILNPLQKIKIKKCINGSDKISFGDLVIWTNQGEFKEHGHVAVVVKIKNNQVYIAEQNTTNKSWNGKKYSRKLLFNNNILVDREYPDTKIIGWIQLF
jgi:glutathionylspermidine amidase/synthetase